MQQKRISESGTQQLLLDTYNIKTMLLQLHHLGLPTDKQQQQAVVPAMYMKLITSKITHIEVILKLIGTPVDMLLERFKIMWPEGGASDLVAVLTLQGVRHKQDQAPYLEQFGRDTGKYLYDEEEAGSHGEGELDSKMHPSSNGGSHPPNAAGSSSSSSATAAMASSMAGLGSSTRSAIGDLTKQFKFGRNS